MVKLITNRRVVVKSRPQHYPTEDNLSIVSGEVDLEGSHLKEGEILVKTLWASLDPYLIKFLGLPGDEPKPPTYWFKAFKDFGTLAIGATFGGGCAGQVLVSKNPAVTAGDLVAADWGWEEYATFNPDLELTFEKLDNDIFTLDPNDHSKARLSTALGLLGVSGSHAYYGLEELKLKEGDTLVVSSAGGNIGAIVGQLGKAMNCKTIGLTGGPEKAKILVEKGLFDIGLDYKDANGDVAALSKKIKSSAPNGIHGYFDNAGEYISDAVWEHLVEGSHAYKCGSVVQYTSGAHLDAFGPREVRKKNGVTETNAMQLLSLYVPNIPKARKILWEMMKEGKVKPVEHVTKGFENLPAAFVAMYRGANVGKAVVQV